MIPSDKSIVPAIVYNGMIHSPVSENTREALANAGSLASVIEDTTQRLQRERGTKLARELTLGLSFLRR